MKIKTTFLLFIMTILYSCNDYKSNQKVNEPKKTEHKADTIFVTKNSDSIINSEQYIVERLPKWLLMSNVINELTLNKSYKIENRLNPLYLEADFNGDGNLDIAVPIFEKNTDKKGFAIIHGKTFEVFILGTGRMFKNALGDNQDYIDIWGINRDKVNEPGVEEETGNSDNGDLILANSSLKIEKSEVGGGIIYWNGNEYAYFHQTD